MAAIGTTIHQYSIINQRATTMPISVTVPSISPTENEEPPPLGLL
jgi:hypothetical protein